MKSFLSTLLFIAALNANAQIELFKDINSDPELNGSGINHIVELDGIAYFGASDMTHGRELWRSDGTDEGTYMVADILPGSESGFSHSILVMNSILYFRGENGDDGQELFRSDGTAEGTYQVYDIYDGPIGSSPDMLTAAGNFLFFRALDETHGIEFWRSDGSAEGTILLKDAVEGASGNSNIYNLEPAGDILYYTCTTPEYGYELWKSDGSPEGTEMVKDITQGSASTQLSEFTFFKDKLYFNAKTPGIGQEIWVSDGTDEGTSVLLDIAEGVYSSYAKEFTASGDLLFFTAQDQYGIPSLWKSDGTPEGTQRVENISEGYGKDLLELTDINGTLYYSANNEYGSELWRSDGTLEGTYMIKDINAVGSSNPRYITNVDGMIVFSAETEGYGRELWKSDGSAEGTVPVKDIYPGEEGSLEFYSLLSSRIFEVNDKAFFPASDGTAGIELWVSDGTSNGTTQIDINTGSQESSVNMSFEYNGFNFFLANDGIHGSELWKSDGTPEGTQLFLDLNEGEGGIHIYGHDIVLGEKSFYFWASLGDQSFELWKSDGTAEGSKKVIDGDPNSDELLSIVGDSLYFIHRNAESNDEIWLTDGTEAGTRLVKDIDRTVYWSRYIATEYNGLLIFRADLPSNESRLWRCDGSPEGTYLITAFNAEEGSKMVNNFIEYDDTLYISVHNGTIGGELWKSDGTNEATSFFMSFDESPGYGVPYFIGVYSDRLLFTARSPEHGSELWSSDGSIAYTSMIKDIIAGQTSVHLRNSFVQLGNQIYFTVVNHPDYGAELWRTDLTENGTQIVRDISQGPSSSNPIFIITANDALYFNTSSESFPYRNSIWKSEGDSCSTVKLVELEQSRYFENLFAADNKIVYVSSFENYGRELVSYNTDFDPVEPCKLDQVIDFELIGDMTEGDGPEALVATASSGLEVSFFSSSSTVLVNNAEITALSAGKAEVSASQEGDEFFRQAGELTQTICINPVQPVISGELSGQTFVLSTSGEYNNQWYFNGTLLADETGSTLIAEQDGVYTVQSSFEGCKSIMSEDEIVTLSGIQLLNEAGVSIYPNPASTELLISFPASGHRNIKIYDSLGKGMLSFIVEGLEAKIDLGSFTSGTYLMLIHSESNIQSHLFNVSTAK